MARTFFRDAVCEKFACPAGAYPRAVFWHCLHGHAKPLVELFWRLAPQMFADDLDLIEAVGATTSLAQFCDQLKAHRRQHPPSGLFRDLFFVRLADYKLVWLASAMFEPKSHRPSTSLLASAPTAR